MDAIAALLDGPRAVGAFVLRSSMDPPWSVRVQDRAPLTLVAIVRGGAWLLPDGGDPVRLGAGDVAITAGPGPYTVADDPGMAPQAVIHPGQRCTTPDGRELELMRHLGVRTWGNSPDGATVMVTGTYGMEGEVSGRLLRTLPPLITVARADLGSPLVELMAAEIVRDAPGQAAVLDRLLDLLLIAALRAWFARPGAAAPGWYRAHADPEVGRALTLVHDDPARPWTVASLAAAVGLSRAAFARRFTRLVGEPPMAYVTAWRIALAADLLREPGQTIAAVARAVGYANPYALSAAFRRVRGVSPREYRSRAGALAA